MLLAGAALLYIGCRWMLAKWPGEERMQDDRPGRDLSGWRRPVECAAVAGALFALVRAAALVHGLQVTPAALWVLAALPVLIEFLIYRIVVPGAYRSGFLEGAPGKSLPRALVAALMRLRLLGYPAVALIWPDSQDLLLWTRHPALQAIASICVALLFGSQAVILHFGLMRPTASASRAEWDEA